MTFEHWAQLVGLVATLVIASSYQAKTKKEVYLVILILAYYAVHKALITCIHNNYVIEIIIIFPCEFGCTVVTKGYSLFT